MPSGFRHLQGARKDVNRAGALGAVPAPGLALGGPLTLPVGKVSRVMATTWHRHLPSGIEPGAIDLLAERSLPQAWARRWAEAPDRDLLFMEQQGWLSAGAFDRATRAVAGRLPAARPPPRDRVILSAPPSLALGKA